MPRYRFETKIDVEADDLSAAYGELKAILESNDDVVPWWGVFDVWDEDGRVENPSKVGMAILKHRKGD